MTDEERRKVLYERLNAIVQEFAALEAKDQETNYFPGAHVLVIGYDMVDPDDGGIIGSTGVYPANGSQAGWKSRGLMHEALALYSGAGDRT